MLDAEQLAHARRRATVHAHRICVKLRNFCLISVSLRAMSVPGILELYLRFRTGLGGIYGTVIRPELMRLLMTNFDINIPKYRCCLVWNPPHDPRFDDLTLTMDLIYDIGINEFSHDQLRWALVKGPWPWNSRPVYLHAQVGFEALEWVHRNAIGDSGFYDVFYDEEFMSFDDDWNAFFTHNRPPVCVGCHRFPGKILEYRQAAVLRRISAERYVYLFEDTYCEEMNVFWCIKCWMRAGLPRGVAQW